MKVILSGLLFSLISFVALSNCQNEKSGDNDLSDPIEERADEPPDLSTQTPQQVVRSLYDAVNDQRYEYAYRMWDQDGKASGKTLQEFEQSYEHTAETAVNVTGEITIEGAAGSLYATVPVRIETELKSGEQQAFTGHYVLRRRNINPDSLPNPWQIYDADLKKNG